MRLACSTASFPVDRLPIAVAKAAWAGYAGVELALPEGPLPEAEEVRARLRADELTLAAVDAGALPAGPDDLEALTRLGRAAALARELDGGLVVVAAPAGGTPDMLIAALRLLDRALGDLAVRLALVNRPGTLADTPEALHALWRREPPARLALALDPGQALAAGWNPTRLDGLPALPTHAYLTDRRAGAPVPPGEGEADLPGLVATLRRHGYDGWLTLRLEGADPWAVEPLAREVRELAAAWLV